VLRRVHQHRPDHRNHQVHRVHDHRSRRSGVPRYHRVHQHPRDHLVRGDRSGRGHRVHHQGHRARPGAVGVGAWNRDWVAALQERRYRSVHRTRRRDCFPAAGPQGADRLHHRCRRGYCPAAGPRDAGHQQGAARLPALAAHLPLVPGAELARPPGARALPQPVGLGVHPRKSV